MLKTFLHVVNNIIHHLYPVPTKFMDIEQFFLVFRYSHLPSSIRSIRSAPLSTYASFHSTSFFFWASVNISILPFFSSFLLSTFIIPRFDRFYNYIVVKWRKKVKKEDGPQTTFYSGIPCRTDLMKCNRRLATAHLAIKSTSQDAEVRSVSVLHVLEVGDANDGIPFFIRQILAKPFFSFLVSIKCVGNESITSDSMRPKLAIK